MQTPQRATVEATREGDLVMRGINGDARRTIRIPIDERGQMLVNYAGLWTETFLPHYGFSGVLALAATPEGRREIGARFKGATVLILTTA